MGEEKGKYHWVFLQFDSISYRVIARGEIAISIINDLHHCLSSPAYTGDTRDKVNGDHGKDWGEEEHLHPYADL